MNGKQITAIALVVIVVFLAYESVFFVTPRQRVVKVQMGKILGHNYEPGLHFKWPFIQKVRRFDKRVRTLTGEIDRALTSENKNLTVDYYVKWRISDTVKYYLSTHGSAARARSLIKESVENDLLAEFSKRTVRQAITGQRHQIVSAVHVQANRGGKSLGVHIKDIRIMRLDLPKKVSQTVYARMRSERQEVIHTLRAQGQAAAQEIRSDAQRERTALLARAYKKAQIIKGQGDAKAAAAYAKVYTRDPEFYSFYRSLELYRNNIGSDDFLLLKPNGKLFKYFNPKSGGHASGKSGG